MEHTSETVAEGKLIGETTYPERAEKYSEIEVDGIKIDYYDSRNKVVHEIKKSSSVEQVHIAQVKYYIYKLTEKGIEGVTGIVEYPKLKQRQEVQLEEGDLDLIRGWEKSAIQIIENTQCPPLLHSKICQKCSYYDFCYSTEREDK